MFNPIFSLMCIVHQPTEFWVCLDMDHRQISGSKQGWNKSSCLDKPVKLNMQSKIKWKTTTDHWDVKEF